MSNNARPSTFFQKRLAFSLFLLPWLVWSTQLWSFLGVAPLSTEVFEKGFHLLGGYRVVLPIFLLHPFLVLASYINPVMLLLWVALLWKLIPGSTNLRTILALGIGVAFYKLGVPGEISLLLVNLCFSSLILLPLLTRLSPVHLWIVFFILITATLLTSTYLFAVFWLAISLSAGGVLHYLLAERGHLTSPFRKNLFRNSMKLFATTLLLLSSALILYTSPRWEAALLIPSPHFWLPIVNGLLCVIMAWHQPWETNRWLSIAIFAQGPLLSQDLFIPSLLLACWLMVSIALESTPKRKLKEIKEHFTFSPRLRKLTPPFILIVLVSAASVQSSQYLFERKWNPAWQQFLPMIKDEEPQGFFIIGKAIPLLSYFYRGNLVQNQNMKLETSSEELLQWMRVQNLSGILVEKEYLKEEWKQWIREGVSPQRISEAVVTKLVRTQEGTIEFQTPSSSFSIQENAPEGFVWIQKNDQV